jgi:hypothetical protein
VRLQIEKTPLVRDRVERGAAPFLHFFGERDHLVDGVFAGEAPDKLLHHQSQVCLRFAGPEIRQDLDHHRNHHVHPAAADERECAVEIK